MSMVVIDQVLQRWFVDPAFRDVLANDPKVALDSYDLDKEERERKYHGDPGVTTPIGQGR